jgi:hypothetical protein
MNVNIIYILLCNINISDITITQCYIKSTQFTICKLCKFVKKDKLNIMAGNKNNPAFRQEHAKLMYKGQEYKPCLYDGRAVGEGCYMTGAINGDMILDENGKPYTFRSIPRD